MVLKFSRTQGMISPNYLL